MFIAASFTTARRGESPGVRGGQVVCTHNGVLSGLQKEGNSDTSYKVD